MKKESSARGVEDPSSRESSPRSPCPPCGYEYDDLPIDLRKKVPKEDIDDNGTRRATPPATWVDSWHKFFTRALPPAPAAFGNGVAFPGHPVFSSPSGYPPVIADLTGNRYALVRTADGTVVQVPIGAERAEPPRSHENKENESCTCASCQHSRNGEVHTLDLRKGAQDCSRSKGGDRHSTPTLIRFLEGRPESPKPEQDAPEDLSPSKSRSSEGSISNEDDSSVRRSSSCPKLFEITSESLVERLMRARCKSDSEIQHKATREEPPQDRSREVTLKRRILGGLAASDSEDRDAPSPLTSPGSKQIRVSPSPKDSPVEDTESVLLQQLRHLGPAAFPWSIYSYYAQLMQRMHDHEALKRHLQAGVPTTPSPSDVTGEPDEGVGTLDAFGSIRKRAPRALTGKHVKQGTGASPSTLLTLRQKIQERQKAKEMGLLEPTKPFKGRLGKSFGKVPVKKAVKK